MHGHAIDITSLFWLPLLGEEKTQMRRMLKEAADAEGGNGGLLSELHALVASGVRNSVLVFRTTWPLSTTVTCGATFLETSTTVTQFDPQDGETETNAEFIASTPE